MVIHIINLRMDAQDPQHTHCTLFMNGGNCGTLTFRNTEYEVFAKVISLGGVSFNQCQTDRVTTKRTKL